MWGVVDVQGLHYWRYVKSPERHAGNSDNTFCRKNAGNAKSDNTFCRKNAGNTKSDNTFVVKMQEKAKSDNSDNTFPDFATERKNTDLVSGVLWQCTLDQPGLGEAHRKQ